MAPRIARAYHTTAIITRRARDRVRLEVSVGPVTLDPQIKVEAKLKQAPQEG